jgi:molecular chaperone Hsp33
MTETCRRFIFEEQDILGVVISMPKALQAVLDCHHYPAAVEKLLAECLIANTMMASFLNQKGELTTQLNAGGSISVLVAKSNADLNIRGVSQFEVTADQQQLEMDFSAAQLMITFYPEQKNEPTQSIVDIHASSVSESLERYFLQSEQVPTLIFLDHAKGFGLLLQKMPGEKDLESTYWKKLRVTLADLIIDKPVDDIEACLKNTFSDQLIRVFDPEPVQFLCPCSEERMLSAVRTLSQEDINELLKEQGAIDIVCEYCLHEYQFSASELE